MAVLQTRKTHPSRRDRPAGSDAFVQQCCRNVTIPRPLARKAMYPALNRLANGLNRSKTGQLRPILAWRRWAAGDKAVEADGTLFRFQDRTNAKTRRWAGRGFNLPERGGSARGSHVGGNHRPPGNPSGQGSRS